VPALAQPFEKTAGVLELLGSRALREIAADDDEVRFQLVGSALDRSDDFLVVRPEMKVGQMEQPGHERLTP
jgi:hypothetical protein